jgi:DNA-binding transcriptional ArsR family regulator
MPARCQARFALSRSPGVVQHWRGFAPKRGKDSEMVKFPKNRAATKAPKSVRRSLPLQREAPVAPDHHARQRAERIAEKLKYFAQAQRVIILLFLAEGEHTVGKIEESTGIRQPTLSQQLAVLRRGGLVSTRRVAKQVYYQLANKDVLFCIEAFNKLLGRDE